MIAPQAKSSSLTGDSSLLSATSASAANQDPVAEVPGLNWEDLSSIRCAESDMISQLCLLVETCIKGSLSGAINYHCLLSPIDCTALTLPRAEALNEYKVKPRSMCV